MDIRLRRCLGSLLLLSPRLHQEGCTDINAFVWRLCVGYRPLNGVTKSFEYPTPRCSDSIEDFDDFSDSICFISLDDRTSYHQIQVRKVKQEKMALFTLVGKSMTFKVMPFGPKNVPDFYTIMMHFLRDKWILLCNETRHIISLSNSLAKVICNNRIIIDDILLFSNHTPTLLYYFSCVARVFTKHQLSFKLSKLDYLKDRVEYVGYDLTSNGNCPARSKFSLIQDWIFFPHGISLHRVMLFYHNYCPWFETNSKPLRKIQRSYHPNNIPSWDGHLP